MNCIDVVKYLARETLEATDNRDELEANVDYDMADLTKRVHEKAQEMAETFDFKGAVTMIRRFIGELEIRLQYCGRSDNNWAKYLGYILLPDGQRHNFTDLCSGVGLPGTRAEDFDEMAKAAVDFASYYTSHNRGDDLPDWAPSADLADAIEDAAMCGMKEEGGYEVRRNQ